VANPLILSDGHLAKRSEGQLAPRAVTEVFDSAFPVGGFARRTSTPVELNRNRCLIKNRIEHGRVLLGKLDELFLLRLRDIRIDFEVDPDVLIPHLDVLGYPEKAPYVYITLVSGFYSLYLNTPGRPVGNHCGRQTTRKRGKKILHRIGSLVGSPQHRRFVHVKNHGLPGVIFLPCSVKVLERLQKAQIER